MMAAPFVLPLLMSIASAVSAQAPIIDMHMHASPADNNGPPPLALCVPLTPAMPPAEPGRPWAEVVLGAFKNPQCPNPIWSPTTDDGVMMGTIEAMKRYNIVIGVLSGPPDQVSRWQQAAPGRFIPSLQFRIGRDQLSPNEMRRLFASSSFAVLGEVSNQYAGIGPNDERMQPYWALAEELDIPVAIHMGGGAPGAVGVDPTFRVRYSNPLLLEDVLARHPNLRISVMHYGDPFVDEMIAMLAAYPNIYVDLGGIQWTISREGFYSHLKAMVDAGFANRIMFGSDQMTWPGVIEPSIAIIEEAPFLTDAQKRDIFYNNAARFLLLSKKEIARHHSMSR